MKQKTEEGRITNVSCKLHRAPSLTLDFKRAGIGGDHVVPSPFSLTYVYLSSLPSSLMPKYVYLSS